MKKLLFPLALLTLLGTGCSYVPERDIFTISRCLENAKASKTLQANNNCIASDLTANEIVITDLAVAVYFSEVSKIMRRKATKKRRIRELSSAGGVLTAATAAILNETKDSGATVTVLGAASVLLLDLQRIFGAGEESAAYTDGLVFLERAAASYLPTLVDKHGKPPNDTLTPAGAQLLRTTQASIHLVELALASKIPSPEELQHALGRHSILAINETDLTLPAGATAEVPLVSGEEIIRVSSSNIAVATAAVGPDKDRVMVTHQSMGNAIITVVGPDNQSIMINVSAM